MLNFKKAAAIFVVCPFLLAAGACGPSDPSGIPGDATLSLGRATELAEQVERLPAVTEVAALSGGGTAAETVSVTSDGSPRSLLSSLSVETGSRAADFVDLSDPEANELYQTYRADAGKRRSDDDLFVWADRWISSFKRLSAYVREKAIMLDTWIAMPSESYEFMASYAYFRLGYDRNSDVATVEAAGDLFYCRILVTETAEGKTELSAASVAYVDTAEMQGPVTVTCSYREDVWWDYTMSTGEAFSYYNFLCECDLAAKEFCLYSPSGSILLRRMEPDIIDLSVAYEFTEGPSGEHVVDKGHESDFLRLFDESGTEVGSVQIEDSFIGRNVYFNIDPYLLGGWDSFCFEKNTYYLERGGERVLETPVEFSDDGSISVTPQERELNGQPYKINISYDHTQVDMPCIQFAVPEPAANMSCGELISALFENEGFTVKSQAAAELIARSDDIRGLQGEFDKFEWSDPAFKTAEEAMEFLRGRLPDFPAADELADLVAGSTPMNEQTPDEHYYYSYAPAAETTVPLSGSATELDLTGVKLTLERNTISSEGEYALVAVAVGEFGAAELGMVTGTFGENALTLTGLPSLPLSSFAALEDGEYRICVCLARKIGETWLRASDFFDLTAPAAEVSSKGEKDISLISDGTSLTVTVALPEPSVS